MKRITAFLALVAITAAAASTVTRASVSALEKAFDGRLDRDVLEGNPYLLLSMTHGIYLDGFGVVYSAEVSLAPLPGINPFHQQTTKADWLRLRQKKLQRLPILRQSMKAMLLDTAASLDGMPAEEQMVLGVRIVREPGEDATGIPSEIVMRAQKRNLLDIHTGKRDRSQLDTFIKVQEF